MIYVIKSGPFVKIGFCDRDPIRRLEKLQIGNPIKLRLIALLVGTRSDEGNWHCRFDDCRVRGEWFKLTEELKAALEPHLVDHDHVSRNRPARVIEGFAARQVEEGFRRIGILPPSRADALYGPEAA